MAKLFKFGKSCPSVHSDLDNNLFIFSNVAPYGGGKVGGWRAGSRLAGMVSFEGRA